LFSLESGELIGRYHNIGLLLSIEHVKSQIKIYTLHLEGEDKVEMVVDTIVSAKIESEKRVQCITAAAANLKLEPNFELI
jgi:hypothetical protein